ncbi:MAG: sulfotransferase [Magnetococcales bacterium]|nr:sulfotransferase [Magnetococcales bacterium]
MLPTAADQLPPGVEQALMTYLQRPNEPALVDLLDQIVQVVQYPAWVRQVVMEWFFHPQIELPNRSRLYLHMLKIIDDMKEFDASTLGKNQESRAFRNIFKSPPYHVGQALSSLDLIDALDEKRYTIHNTPKFIVALWKSASTMLGLCLGMMVAVSKGEAETGGSNVYRGYPDWWYTGDQDPHDWELRPEVGADPLFRCYPGGVYKGHIHPTPNNLKILDLYDSSRYVLIIRDPRDQLVATYCAEREGRTEVPSKQQIHERMSQLMQDGTLFDALHFSSEWLKKRDPERSIVITFEQLMHDPMEALRRMNTLYQLGLDEAALQAIHQRADGVTNRHKGAYGGSNPSKYPLGWSGAKGVWEQYFSTENRVLFQRSVQNFRELFHHGCGDALMEVYPDLLEMGLQPSKRILHHQDRRSHERRSLQQGTIPHDPHHPTDAENIQPLTH